MQDSAAAVTCVWPSWLQKEIDGSDQHNDERQGDIAASRSDVPGPFSRPVRPDAMGGRAPEEPSERTAEAVAIALAHLIGDLGEQPNERDCHQAEQRRPTCMLRQPTSARFVWHHRPHAGQGGSALSVDRQRGEEDTGTGVFERRRRPCPRGDHGNDRGKRKSDQRPVAPGRDRLRNPPQNPGAESRECDHSTVTSRCTWSATRWAVWPNPSTARTRPRGRGVSHAPSPLFRSTGCAPPIRTRLRWSALTAQQRWD